MKVRFFLSLSVLYLLLFGCAQTREPAITPIPTSTQILTATPVIELSKTATITATFTLTPQPTPFLAVLSTTNISQIEQVNTFETAFHRFVWSPDSLKLLIISWQQIKLIDAYSLDKIWSKDVKNSDDPFTKTAYDGSYGLNGLEIALAMDGDLVFVNADSGAEIRRIACSSDFEMLSYLPNGHSVAFGHTESIRQVGIDSYAYVTNSVETCDPGLLQKLDKSLYQLEFSPDGKYLMGVFSGLTFLWKTSDNSQYASFKSTGFASFNGDGTLLATTDGDEVTLWKVDTLKPVGFYKNISWKIALNPNGRILATTYSENKSYKDWTIKLWDTKTGNVLIEIRDLPGTPYQLGFSPDGRLLAGLFYGENSTAPQDLVIWGVK